MEGGGSFGGVFRPLFADARFDKPRNFQKVLIGVHEAAAAVAETRFAKLCNVSKGFNWVCAKLLVGCADSRFAKPRNFP